MEHFGRQTAFLIFILSITTLVLAHTWEAPKEEAVKKNPLTINESVVISGKTLYSALCAGCHGETALGADDANTDMKGPANLIKRLKGHSDGDFFWKIRTGRNDMPSFGEELDEKEIWQIISYLNVLAAQ